ncbi:MAG: SIMPL domain-containing protein [Luteibaculum sp.]
MSKKALPYFFIFLGLAVAGFFVSTALVKAKKFDRIVRVKGLAEREVPANLAIWPMEISLAGNNLAELESLIDKQKKTVSDFFHNFGFGPEEFKVGITNIRDNKTEFYGGAPAEFRYIAKTEITLRTDKIELLLTAQSASNELLRQGVVLNSKNSWRPVEYSFTGLNEIKPEMIAEATKNARKAAEQFKADSDAQLGDIYKADQGLFSISDRDMNTPEIKTIRVVSTIEFYLN